LQDKKPIKDFISILPIEEMMSVTPITSYQSFLQDDLSNSIKSKLKSLDLEKFADKDSVQKSRHILSLEKDSKMKRSVRFDLDRDSKPTKYEHPPLDHELTLDLIGDLWWTVDDMAQFKQSVFDMAAELRSSSKVRRLLRNVMKAATGFANHSFWNPNIRQDQDGMCFNDALNQKRIELNEETGSITFLGIVDWCRYHEERRGIEKWSCYNYFEARERLYYDGVEGVLKEQMKHRVYGVGDPNSVERDRQTAALRNVSLRSSRPAQQLAVAMGAADAAALIKIEDECNEKQAEVTCFSKFFHFSNRKKFNRI